MVIITVTTKMRTVEPGTTLEKSTGDYCGDDDAIDNDSDISLIVAGGLWQCRHHRLPVQKNVECSVRCCRHEGTGAS